MNLTSPPSPMLDARQFDLVCACVLAAALAHLAHLSAPIAALIFLLLLGRWLQRRRGGARLSAWIKLPLLILFSTLVIAKYGNIFGREPGAVLACAMLALKLVETDVRRDALAAVGFASFVLMSALLFDTSLVFTLALFASLVLILATLHALQPRAVFSKARNPRHALRADLRSGLLAFAAALPLALIGFLFFPRLDSPLWRTPDDASARSGLSESMAPGSIQNLLIDDSAAFRVNFDGSPPARAQLYWRGPVLTDFDGTTWTRRVAAVASAKSAALQSSGAAIGYEVTLEATDQPWLFALDMPLDAPADATRRSDMTLLSRRPVAALLRYRATSAPVYRLDLVLPAEQRRATTALPQNFDPRAVELAQSWRRDLGDDQAIVHAALEFFHNAFFYTLSPPPLGRDSIDDFLFSTRRGFCEHFAGAFVFLMRAAGISARIVTGYQGGYFNNVGNYLLVRQSDAHAWAEIWLDGKGWLRVDPTAAVSPARVELGALAAAGISSRWYQAQWIIALRNQFDLINRGWNDVIVGFNSLRQQSLLAPFGIEHIDYATLTWLLIGSSSVLLCSVTVWIMHNPRRRIDPLDAAYATLCAKLALAGATRAPTEGPHAFAQRLSDVRSLAGPSVRQAQALLADYVSLRYARAFVVNEAVEQFARAVRRWRVKKLA